MMPRLMLSAFIASLCCAAVPVLAADFGEDFNDGEIDPTELSLNVPPGFSIDFVGGKGIVNLTLSRLSLPRHVAVTCVPNHKML